MILLGVSGGPDSMLLLNDYKKKDIVVAHVNYHQRKDSVIDEKVVRDFCKKNNITLEVLSVKEKPKNNFQDWARKVRYEFFEKVYTKYNCSKLLLAHHKDDFLETAIMQQKSKRTPRYFGILKKNNLFGMNIYRPFLNKYFKDQILNICKSEKINYAIDSSNEKNIYERNKIRKEISNKSQKEKLDLYQWFVMSNKILKKKFNKVDYLYKKWEKSNYKLDFIRLIKRHREEIIYEYINHNFKDVKLSSAKITSILDYIDSPEGKKVFVLNNKHSLIKENKYLRKRA